MIARIWHGWTSPADADAYEALLNDEIFASIEDRRIPGVQRHPALRRAAGDEVEFVTIMLFDSVDGVRAFAGAEYERAVVPGPAQALLTRFDERSAHYDVRAERPGR